MQRYTKIVRSIFYKRRQRPKKIGGLEKIQYRRFFCMLALAQKYTRLKRTDQERHNRLLCLNGDPGSLKQVQTH